MRPCRIQIASGFALALGLAVAGIRARGSRQRIKALWRELRSAEQSVVNVNLTETIVLSQRVGVVLGNCLGSTKVGALSTTRRGDHFASISCRNRVKNLVPSQKRHPDDSSGPRHGAAAGKEQRVLVIEDNVDAADNLREVLLFGDHQVEVAYNGPEGLARAREFKPEVVLCDIGLPSMDGYEVARAFRADDATKGVFLVALSGYALPEDLQRAQEAGFDRHLAKPPSIEKIEEALASGRSP